MKLPRLYLILTMALMAGCSTAPDTGNQAPASATAASAQESEATASAGSDSEMVCRREIVTGSNFRREVCMTRAQRREIRDNSREQVTRNRNFPAEVAPTQ